MAISFLSASVNGRIERAIHPRLAANGGGTYYPFFVGCWINPATVSTTGTVWSFGNSASASNYISMTTTSTANFGLNRNDAGGTITNTVAGAVANKWFFTLALLISPTVGRLFVCASDGSLMNQSLSATTTVQPTGLDNLALSTRRASTPTNPWTGAIAEFYYGLGTPIGQGAFGQISTAPQVFRQLAQRGPFSIPGMGDSLLEYRSFVKGNRVLDGETDLLVGGGSTNWFIGGGATPLQGLAPHPPLSPLYRRPGRAARVIGI